MPFAKSDKIIIVGAGVYGLSTALAFLESGFTDIHVFDKNDYFNQSYSYFKGCDSASSDMNKIFRASYGDQVHYQKMALASRDTFLKWNEMIKKENWEGGEPVYINSGNIHLTDLKTLPPFEQATLKSMGDEAICVADADAEEKAMKKGLPKASVDPFLAKERGLHLQGIVDTTGGIMVAEKMCRWVLTLCQRVGGSSFHPHFGKKSGEIQTLLMEYNKTTGGKKCVGIKTKNGEVHFSKTVVVLSGAWTAQIVPEAGEKVEATGGTVALFKVDDPKHLERFSPNNFPAWTYKVRDGAMGGLYGFPVNQGYMKIGYRGTKWINPSGNVNSKVKTAYTEDRETNVPLFGLTLIKNFVREHLPELDRISKTRLCWYSDTCDNDFLISYCPYYEDNSLFVGCGDSGHAFMMFGVIGKVIKDTILGEGDEFLRDLFSWERERVKLNIMNMGDNDARALHHLRMASPKDWIINPAKM
ncbi:hypothetical protein DASC09_006070 [Saccharomycopsis crataegensis]|uniref:FAD dependent oxidoreductase domain-containing protein n=1 Tax=Saccharomycopsis crataegensis TaxID=43959 RepID=A0AAV5QEW8_9ASCO|nr:hypothetical protein DASC09_006070 [Saccharomycopsis crataegensis]